MTKKEFWAALAFLLAVILSIAVVAIGGCKKPVPRYTHQYIYTTTGDADPSGSDNTGAIAMGTWLSLHARDQNELEVYPCDWTSSDSAIASISYSGNLFAHSPGMVLIHVACPDGNGGTILGLTYQITVFNPEGEQ